MHNFISAVTNFVEAHHYWAYALVFFLATSEALPIIGAVVPASAIIVAISALVPAGAVKLVPLIVSAAAGAILGDGFSYWLGRHYHRQIGDYWPLKRYPGLIAKGEGFFQRHGGKSVIIACDAALKPLVAHGLAPDIVVNLDPQLYTSNFFEGIDTRNIALVAPTIVHPSLREQWKGPFFFYNKHAPDIPVLAKISLNHPQVGALIPGGSVLSVAYDLAFKSAADPIAFIGQDLGYPGGNAYAAGTHFDSFEAASIFDQPGDVIVEERDIFGRTLKTQKSMAVTKQWFGWAFANWQPELKRRIFNCSEAGILTNCPLMTFGEFVSRYCRKGANVAWGIKKAAKG